MAAKEVIHFPFGAQLSTHLQFPALVPPEPVAKSPPQVATQKPNSPCYGLALHKPKYTTLQSQTGKGKTLRADIYAELYFWNKNIDSLIRVLQRIEILAALPQSALKRYEVQLEELRASFNSDLLEAILTQERTDQWRLSRLREALERAHRTGLVQGVIQAVRGNNARYTTDRS